MKDEILNISPVSHPLMLLALSFVIISADPNSARAESELQLHLGTSISNPMISTLSQNDSKYQIAAGLSIALEFAPKTYLETGFHIRGHTFAESSTTEISYTDMVVPVVGRYRLLPWLDLGAGLYYAVNPDSFKRKNAGSISTVRFDSAGLESAEWGFRLNPRFYYGKNKNWFVDVCYDHGIKDLDKGNTVTWKNRVYTFSLGFSFGLGGTPVDPDSYAPTESKEEKTDRSSSPKSKSKIQNPEYEGSPPI